MHSFTYPKILKFQRKGNQIDRAMPQNSVPARRPKPMNPITSLPIIQKHNLLDSQKTNQQRENHNHPLHGNTLDLNKTMSHKRQKQTHKCIQESNSKTLSTKLHSRSLIEKHKLRRIVTILKKHRHFPYNVMHCTRNTKKVNKNRTSQPNPRIMQQCFPSQKLLNKKRQPDQNHNNNENNFVSRQNRRTMNWSHREFRFHFHEFRHRFSKSREIPLIHMFRILQTMIRTHETNMRKSVNTELRETELRFFEFDFTKEEFWKRWRVSVVGNEWRSDDGEFFVKFGEFEFRFVMKLSSVEEDEKRIGSWGFDGS